MGLQSHSEATDYESPRHRRRAFTTQHAMRPWVGKLVCICIAGWIGLASSIGSASRVSAAEATPSVADGTLHACAILSIDQAIAVGDRGLILRSEDGGKTWNIASARGTHTYFATGFDPPTLRAEPRTGLVVGGRIDPITGRSEGVVEWSRDDGKTWTRSKALGLPRLLGLQRIAHRHWIAWGDWSDHWQSSLFETLDGGDTWNARPSPSGHLRCAAVDAAGRAIVIDRAGAGYVSNDGIEYHPLTMPVDPFRPLRFCRTSDQGWWLGGDHGRLYHSMDGSTWTQIALPGDASDHALIQLKDAAIVGPKLWIVGSPGSVVWHSEDSGRHWKVLPSHHPGGLNAIQPLDENVLLACGEFGRIDLSRNGGNAWIGCHRSGSRVACQVIAATARSNAWDVLAYVAYESKRRASAIIVHRQDLHGALGRRPEMDERIVETGRQLGLEKASVMTEFPVGDLRTGLRSTDLGYYRDKDPSRSELIRRLAFEIRCARPDLIVAEDTASRDSLDAATAVATQQAIQLAGSPTYRCFSTSSGIELAEWTAQRVLLRGNESGGLTFSPTMLLPSSNMLLGEVILPALFLDSTAFDDNHAGRTPTYRLAAQRTVNIKHPLDGMILDRDTLAIEPKQIRRKVAAVLAASNAAAKLAQLQSTRGAGLFGEPAWDDSLATLTKDLPSEAIFPSLWRLALESRRAGNWHRWNTVLNLIIDRDPEGSMAELAYREWMSCVGSPEVHRAIQDQWTAVQAAKSDSANVSVEGATVQSSPFSNHNQVALASFDSLSRTTPIARLRGTETFARLLARWPDSWQPRRSEPEWAWLIASRYRSRSLLRGMSPSDIKDNVFWPPMHPIMSGWSQILAQERQLSSDKSAAFPLIGIPWIESRPFLDGHDDESCWASAAELPLTSAWSAPQSSTRIRIARDAEFLFIHSRVASASQTLASSVKRPAKEPGAEKRRRDSLDPQSDHIRFRLDLDRDYATWFEWGWDRDGATLDQCNDMKWWNPEWFIAVRQERDSWTAEIAIPMASILPSESAPVPASPQTATAAASSDQRPRDVEAIDWNEQAWGISVVRERPSEPLESLPACETDRWTRDRWILVTPSRARSLQPEQPARISDGAAGFPPADR